MSGYKGFDKNLKCRGFQYSVGKKYTHSGDIELCKKGFHFCENPLDVFGYYAPADSRFAEIEAEKNIKKDTDKSVCSSIKIKTEISLINLIGAGVKFILGRVDWKNNKETNTGYQSAATNTGERSAASVEGKDSIACGLGIENKASGVIGCWLVLSEWVVKNNDRVLKSVKSVKVDGKKIKENVFYTVIKGKIAEAKK